MSDALVKFIPLKIAHGVSPERRIENYKASETLQIKLSNYLDSIRHLPIALFKYKKGEAHKLIRSKWELIHGDKDS